MKKLFTFLLVTFLVVGNLFAQYDPKGYFSEDPAFTKGTLKNGLTYYIRKNAEPKDRASFYIIRNAGALLEEDHENGLAHFLEHMAFNGTKHFPEKGIINTLEKYGVAFGRNVNAYTSYDETVYNISSVPMNVPHLLDTCLLILKDWTHYLSLEDEEIDAERGVISEEWRQRRNAGFRIQEKTFPILTKGSQYAVRDVIGSLDVIKNFKPQTLRDFYHTWYRSDLTALVLVGDFDTKEVEQKIKETFSDIPPVKNPKPLPFFAIPEYEEIRYVLATDKEINSSNVQLITLMRNEVKPKDMNYGYFRNALIEGFYNTLIRSRISEIMSKPNPAFMSASIAQAEFTRGYNSYTIRARAKPNEEAAAFKAILTENERVKRFGFLDSELERAKTNMLAGLESSYKQRDKVRNDSYVGPMKSNFLTGTPIVSVEDYYNFAKAVIPTITAKEVSEKARIWNIKQNQTIIVTGPDSLKHLTKEEALKIISEVENDNTIIPYQEETNLSEELIEEKLTGSPTVKEKQLPQFNAVEWTLANGAKVVFRKADYEKDRVALSSYSKGGTSLFDLDMLASAMNAAALVSSFGKANFDPTTLSKMLTGKLVDVRPSISSFYESVSGACAPKDFETMMQLVYMTFQQPRFDETLYENAMEKWQISLKNRNKNPQNIIQDSLDLIMNDYHPRTLLFNEKYLNSISLDKIKRIYLDRIKDASDFTFFIVGNIEQEKAKIFVEKYIGSIKSYNRKETWRDNNVKGFTGKVEKRIAVKMEEPKSLVFMNFKNDIKVNPYNTICMTVLKDILNIRYMENIREKEGGTYGVSVSASSTRLPKDNYSINMSFSCEPERAEDLKPLLRKELDEIIQNGPKQEDLDKVLTNIKKNREQSKPHNSYWMSTIYNYYRTG
ncbi:MAG: insulinase family protein, partial [Bacteroidia bacterium]|nr:insulinase family protein [Bacteroidia bacterium]